MVAPNASIELPGPSPVLPEKVLLAMYRLPPLEMPPPLPTSPLFIGEAAIGNCECSAIGNPAAKAGGRVS
jgi:hypothetical protein